MSSYKILLLWHSNVEETSFIFLSADCKVFWEIFSTLPVFQPISFYFIEVPTLLLLSISSNTYGMSAKSSGLRANIKNENRNSAICSGSMLKEEEGGSGTITKTKLFHSTLWRKSCLKLKSQSYHPSNIPFMSLHSINLVACKTRRTPDHKEGALILTWRYGLPKILHFIDGDLSCQPAHRQGFTRGGSGRSKLRSQGLEGHWRPQKAYLTVTKWRWLLNRHYFDVASRRCSI